MAFSRCCPYWHAILDSAVWHVERLTTAEVLLQVRAEPHLEEK
jgi:hypothetical protein